MERPVEQESRAEPEPDRHDDDGNHVDDCLQNRMPEVAVMKQSAIVIEANPSCRLARRLLSEARVDALIDRVENKTRFIRQDRERKQVRQVTEPPPPWPPTYPGDRVCLYVRCAYRRHKLFSMQTCRV